MERKLYFNEPDKLTEWIAERREVLAVDTETSGLNWQSDKLRTVQFADLNTAHVTSDIRLAIGLLNRYDGPVAMHNFKFDCHFMDRYGLDVKRLDIHDTQTLAHLSWPARSVGLKELSDELGLVAQSNKESHLKALMKKNKWDYGTIPIETAEYWQYGGLDAMATAQLFERYKDISKTDLYRFEMASQRSLYEMECVGVMIDVGYLTEYKRSLDAYIANLREWARSEYDCDLSSQKDVERLLVGSGQTVYRTPTGKISTTVEHLAENTHPIAKALTGMRKATKTSNTFCRNLINSTDRDCISRPTIVPLKVTGRMSMQQFNFQQIPRGKEIRHAVMARPDCKLIMCDYDTMELLAAGYLSGDDGLVESCMKEDVHVATARKVWPGVPITPAHRQTVKNVTYAIQYGAKYDTVANTAGISNTEASLAMFKFKQAYPKLSNLISQVKKEDVIYTPYGRKEVALSSHTKLNYLIQGMCADVLKQAIASIASSDIGSMLRLPIHDELILECPASEATEVAKEVEDHMSQRFGQYSFPCSSEIHERWGDKYA